MREQFENLPEIAEILNKNGGGYYKEHTNDYHHCNLYFDKFLNGAWYAFQEQQGKIDELQARIDGASKQLDLAYPESWGYCVDQAIDILKGEQE